MRSASTGGPPPQAAREPNSAWSPGKCVPAIPFTRAATTRQRIANFRYCWRAKEIVESVLPLPELSPLEKFLERIEDTERAGPGPGQLAVLGSV